ncbi:Alpha-taxilin [Morella rubra]|uniref:Alpha-taxilin n=1 Tax=Morella rubra TaxID=262757 RepID=A0A6A1VYJ6_9ROSI|nr:Alpha-taxilin [Morella rubra]
MQNPDANQLPEVDSLPDGFVEGSTEPPAPPTPTVEQEKPLGDYKDSFPELDHSEELSANECQASQGREEKTHKLRTFPVQLSETDSFEPSEGLVEVPSRDCVEQTEDTLGSQYSPNVSEALAGLAGCSKEKEQVQADGRSSERSTEGVSEASSHLKDISSPESVDASKNRKLETTEAKRKNAKRTFKSEKEFLEFTLKYQQVLVERDSGFMMGMLHGMKKVMVRRCRNYLLILKGCSVEVIKIHLIIAIAVRDKLESLCRELQRQNKILMDECKRVSTEGQSLRLDLSARFQDAIKDMLGLPLFVGQGPYIVVEDVSNKLEEQKDECLSQLKENEMLRTKLKQLVDQYTLSEQQFAQKLKQKTLELQLADLKIQQHAEKLVQEQCQIKLYAEQVSQLLATEKNLRLQLTADGEKFQQFQDALLKSNEVFETFKQEIEKMAKSIKELKKENSFLKSKCEKSDITLIELVDERERLKKQLEKTKNQKEKLESLCRSLQAERKQSSIEIKSSD